MTALKMEYMILSLKNFIHTSDQTEQSTEETLQILGIYPEKTYPKKQPVPRNLKQ